MQGSAPADPVYSCGPIGHSSLTEYLNQGRHDVFEIDRRPSVPSAGGRRAAADEGTRLLRFPDIHGDQVVFSYGGDLWLASTDGGTARRLTAHPGQELFARFSPDGEWVAFTGQYDGDEQVYVVPTAGGEPTRLTWYPAVGPLPPRWGYDQQVYGWSPDGEQVLFRSLRDRGRRCREPRSTRCREPVGCRRRCRCRTPVPPISRPTDRRWSTRRSSATSATGSATGRLGAGSLHLRPRQLRGRTRVPYGSHRARSDVDRRQDLLRLRPRRSPQSL